MNSCCSENQEQNSVRFLWQQKKHQEWPQHYTALFCSYLLMLLCCVHINRHRECNNNVQVEHLQFCQELILCLELSSKLLKSRNCNIIVLHSELMKNLYPSAKQTCRYGNIRIITILYAQLAYQFWHLSHTDVINWLRSPVKKISSYEEHGVRTVL